MIEDPRPLVPPFVAAAEVAAPPTEMLTPGESSLPPPTAEQARAVDDVFASPTQPHPVATALGVWTGVLMLHDVLADAIGKTEEDERSEQVAQEEDIADRLD